MKHALAILAILILTFAPARAGLEEGTEAFITEDYETALRELKPLAEKSNPHALGILGHIYFHGLGVSPDVERAETYLRSAIDKWSGDEGELIAFVTTLTYLLLEQRRYDEAEPVSRKGLDLTEQLLGPLHPETASRLNDLAHILHGRGAYGEAESLFRRAHAIREQALGREHPDTARSLDDLAILLKDRAAFQEAEAVARQALAIKEKPLERIIRIQQSA